MEPTNAILNTASSFESTSYHIEHNNCTSFALAAANQARISIYGAIGTWWQSQLQNPNNPFVPGNLFHARCAPNPANLGQSILSGNFKNMDTGNNVGLTVDVEPPQQRIRY